jgi:hypothetical protein
MDERVGGRSKKSEEWRQARKRLETLPLLPPLRWKRALTVASASSPLLRLSSSPRFAVVAML